MKTQINEQKVFMDYLSDIGAWVLGGAMFIYLGYRSLDFLTFTFREEDALFAYLALFSTTIGAVIFAVIWQRAFYFDRTAQVWRSDEFKKTIAFVMMIVCAMGELILAVADMTIITAQKGGAVMMTEGELKILMWFTAGLAAAVGMSVAAIKLSPRHPQTDPIVDMSNKDADNDGVLDSQQNVNTPPASVNVNALEMRLAELEKENKELKSSNPTNGANSQQPPQNSQQPK